MSTNPVLAIEGLSIKLPAGADRALAVEAVDLELRAGQTLCVVGESGSGKSMLANAVMGLLPVPHVAPVAGRILFEGRDLLALSEDELRALRGRRIGMIFQEPMTSLNPVMRVGEQIGEVLDAHTPLPRLERRARILSALRDVGLPEPEQIVDSFPFRLSGGQRQRVMIAAATVLEPTLLIADEPTTALDVTTQAQILKLMRDLQLRKGMAMLFITHDFGIVADIADHVAVMQFGRLVERGPASEVLRAPQHDYTRRLIAAIPHGQTRASEGAPQAEPLLVVEKLHKTYRRGWWLLEEAAGPIAPCVRAGARRAAAPSPSPTDRPAGGRPAGRIGALSLAMAVSCVVLLAADRLRHWLGDSMVSAIEKLMGLVLSAVAVEMILAGLKHYFFGVA